MTARARSSAPTPFRQTALAVCLLFFCTLAPAARAQSKIYRPLPNYVQMGKPDQAEGRRILEDFRQRGIPGEYYLRFELRELPRRGEGRVVEGRLWGARNDRGPVTRVELAPPGDPAEHRLLVQNGPAGALWSWRAATGSTVTPAGTTALFDPLAGTDLTAFDLQMPFLYWNEFVFEGIARIRGRPAHAFLLYPPADIAARHPALAGVRVYLDTQYNALVQSEQIGDAGRILKSVHLLDLKKVDDHWIVKSIDVRDELTRNKTRFAITGAALGLDLSPALFDPAALAETVRPPAPARIRQVDR